MSLIDFYNSTGTADDGQNTTVSIQPYSNGEAGEQTIFRRPPENLRQRAELLRTAHDGEEVVRLQSDSLLIIPSTPVLAGPPTMTWGGTAAGGGTGLAVLSLDNLNIVPAASSASAPAGVLTANSQIAKIYADFGAGQIFEFVAARAASPGGLRRMHEGAGNIFFRAYLDSVVGAHLPVVTVTGGTDPAAGPIDIVAKLDKVAGVTTNTFTELAAAITAAAGVNIATATAAGAALLINGAGTFLADTATRCRLFETPTYGRNGLDATSYTVPIASFGAVLGALAEGDIVAVDYATTTARRASNWAAPAVLAIIKDGVHSHIGNNEIIPLFKVVNDSLHFFNGVVCPKGIGVSLIHDYAQRGAYAAHIAGTADKHAISHILSTTRPSLVVGPVGATGCDYVDDIQSALTALGASGGTLQIKNGTYTLAAALIMPAGPVVMIGEAPGKVIIAAIGGISAVLINSPNNHVFVNLTFTQPGGENVISSFAAVASGGKTSVCLFDHCTFQFTGASGEALVYAKVSSRFEHCQFLGFDPTQDLGIYVKQVDSYINIICENCYFYKLVHGLLCDTAGAVELIAIRYCVIESCGNTALPATWNYFIDIGDYGVGNIITGQIDISYNHWRNVGTAAAQCGGFCFTCGPTGRVAHNKLERLISIAYISAVYLISCMSTTYEFITIQNNTLICGDAVTTTCVGGIRGVVVLNNIINQYVPKHNGQFAIDCQAVNGNGVIQGNHIVGHSTAATVGARFINDSDAVFGTKICNNNLIITQASAVGIYSASARGVITGNTIKFVGATCIGIELITGSDSCTISDNTIYNAITAGIHIDASNGHRIVDNCIDTGGGIGIQLHTASSRLLIKGNTINSQAVGIDMQNTHTDCVITDNIITDCTTGIKLAKTCTRFVINDNNILCTAAGTARCIYIVNAGGAASLYGTISNNRLSDASAGAGSACIDFGHVDTHYIACGGNMFDFTTATFINNHASIGIGPTGAQDMVHNWVQ